MYWLVFVGMLTPPKPAGGNAQDWLFQPQLNEAAVQNPAPPEMKADPPQDGTKKEQQASKDDAANAEGQMEHEEAEGPGGESKSADEPRRGPQPTAEERSLALTQKFGDALVAQDYKRAYGLMSRIYRRQVTLEAFSAIHRQALIDYGEPLKAEAGAGDTDDGTLIGPEFERFRNIPPRDRVAWTYANLTVSSDPAGTARCCDCWLLLVKSGNDLQVGAFEYEACD